MIAGSTLLTESIPADTRPRTQGAADLTMGICGALAGLVSGVIVGVGSYALLNMISAAIVLLLTAIVVRERLQMIKVEG